MNLILMKKDFNGTLYEFVERKGLGHPDTLSDNLAEYLSAKYSQYTKNEFGAILHHNFDKVGLLGGASDVKFGYGKLTRPIRVLLNGRASTKFGKINIPVKDLLVKWAVEFLTDQLPLKNPQIELEFHYNLSNQSSPGKTEEDVNKQKSTRKYWFEPRSLDDIQELTALNSNDTSMGVGFTPFSKLEKLVLDIENRLNSLSFKQNNEWIGSDIKIMGFRYGGDYKLTMCIPQLADKVADLNEYKQNIIKAHKVIGGIIRNNGITNCEVNINTRDNYEKGELYLTATGSSIESGDEGLVGRGNRVQGFIAPMRLMSMEGAAGKNPVYHIGKVYYLAAQKISQAIHNKFSIENEVVLVSQSGRSLVDPWIVFVHIPQNFKEINELEKLVRHEIDKIPEITEQIINLRLKIC